MSLSDLRSQVALAINAIEDKKGEQISILQMEKGAFTDYLLLASGTNPRQVQAMADEVELRLKRSGVYPNSVEGYQRAEWILLDYVDFVVQLFDEERRAFYDLDRLWKMARKLTLQDLHGKSRAATAPVTSSGGRKKRVISAVGRAARATMRTVTGKPKRTPPKKAKPATPKKKGESARGAKASKRRR